MKNIKLPKILGYILAFTILVCVIYYILLYFQTKYDNEHKKIIIPPSISGVPYSVHYDQVKISCKKGDVQTTISKDKSLKVTVECLENLDKIYNKTYQLPNKNILFVNFFDNRQPSNFLVRQKQFDNGIPPIEAKVFNTKLNTWASVNVKTLDEKEFIYSKSKALPQNKILINCRILFNIKNNRFYKIPDKNMKPYFNFINEPKKQYKDISFVYKFKDSTVLYSASKYTGKHYEYGIWWIEDRISLKRYLEFKSCFAPVLFAKEKNEVFLIDDKYNPFSFNLITGKKISMSNQKYSFGFNNSFIYKDKLIAANWFHIEIFDFKTKKFEYYKISNPNNEPYSVLFPDGYILFSSFFDKQGYLFNLNTKKTFVIDNPINSQELKTNNLNLGGLKCFTHSIDPNSLIESDYNLHFMPVSGSKVIMSGGGVYCYTDSLYYDVKKSEVVGYNIYNTSIKSIAIEKNKVNK